MCLLVEIIAVNQMRLRKILFEIQRMSYFSIYYLVQWNGIQNHDNTIKSKEYVPEISKPNDIVETSERESCKEPLDDSQFLSETLVDAMIHCPT